MLFNNIVRSTKFYFLPYQKELETIIILRIVQTNCPSFRANLRVNVR